MDAKAAVVRQSAIAACAAAACDAASPVLKPKLLEEHGGCSGLVRERLVAGERIRHVAHKLVPKARTARRWQPRIGSSARVLGAPGGDELSTPRPASDAAGGAAPRAPPTPGARAR